MYLLEFVYSTIDALGFGLAEGCLVEFGDSTGQIAPSVVPVFVGVQLVLDSGHPVSVLVHDVFDAFISDWLWRLLGHFGGVTKIFIGYGSF